MVDIAVGEGIVEYQEGAARLEEGAGICHIDVENITFFLPVISFFHKKNLASQIQLSPSCLEDVGGISSCLGCCTP